MRTRRESGQELFDQRLNRMEGGVWVHVISQFFLPDSPQVSGFVL